MVDFETLNKEEEQSQVRMNLLLTPVEAHRDKIHKRTGIEVVFTRSIIEYRIHGETCVCCLTSLSRDSNQGLRYE